MPEFCHLHCHTQYSLLDGASKIETMMDKAVKDGQKGVALTDHGNMFGAFKFVSEANKRDIKPIVGCEFYLVEDRHIRAFSKSKGEKDRRFHQLLLAKNVTGYQNLTKLCSLGFIEGLYGKFPRIDKELLEKYHEGLIATSCCIGAEIPQAILRGDLGKAEELVKWWKDLFGEDFYIELQRHRGLDNIDGLGVSQEDVNQQLLVFAKKYDIKVIATNDSHYVEEEDNQPHDILLCVNTGSKVEDTNRFKFPSTDFYFKSQEEMSVLFKDRPDAIDNTMEIYSKIEKLELKRDVLLPNFPLPKGFKKQHDYLTHLVMEGAKVKYGVISEVLRERLQFELGIIGSMNFDGYFLIVQDFINAAKEMSVAVGPGRGSAAGSAVAYCLGITNIDPIKYNLLFERFLNPERISMPDIDIDFDDDGRQRVIDYVIDKYGQNQVAQIVTFGTMAAKSSIRDVARVTDLPLNDADYIAKLVPTIPGFKFPQIFGKPPNEALKGFQGNDPEQIKKLWEINAGKDDKAAVLQLAQRLEGSVRNTGIHAAGVIIAPGDITNYVPVCTTKDSPLWITQFDGSVVEDAGMLKMDFLGLKTLSIIKDCIENIVVRHGEDKRIDPDEIPLDDEETYKLFQRGDMIGIFQFESDGMRKHMKDLKPTDIEDLIAMNALYRPGPMQYIPLFINRKHGREKVTYPHEWLEDILKPTNGIMVYQEQIMQAAQIMADYTLGQADMLRRAMGKKKVKEMIKHRKTFGEGAGKKGVSKENADKIFDDMEKFASYGFNRSHAAAYSVLAFQTAYLKTHYPAEFMASVLTHNKSDIGKLNFFLRESKRMGIQVLGPDVNESMLNFTVTENGTIRFGMSALKGVGEGPVSAMIESRKKDGPFKSVFDMMRRLSLRNVNKKVMESLAYGGGLDCFTDIQRHQYFVPSGKFESFIGHLLKYGNAYQSQLDSSENSLFGAVEEVMVPEPEVPIGREWPLIEKLNREKLITGIYISGHPLDDYKVEVDSYTDTSLSDIERTKDRNVKIAGIVTMADHRVSKKGTKYGNFALQDFSDSLEFSLFREDYQKYKHLLELNEVLYMEGSYTQKWQGADYQFQPSKVMILASVSSKMTNSVTLRIEAQHLTKEMLNSIEEILDKNKGEQKLKVQLLDRQSRIHMPFVSKNKKVAATSDLFDDLEKMGISFKIN